MKNITEQKPTDVLYGRTRFAASFVDRKDIKGKKCLDIGCGYGWMELYLIGKEASLVTGTELDEKDLRTIKKYIHDTKIKSCVGNAISLPFSDKSFDTVISWEVIEHIPRDTEKTMFLEVWRVLKPGGVFYLSTPYFSWSTFFDPAWYLIGHRHYTKGKLLLLALKTGFHIGKVEIRGGFWEIVGLLNLYISKWIFRRGPLFEKALKEKLDNEWERKNGCANIFIQMRKPG